MKGLNNTVSNRTSQRKVAKVLAFAVSTLTAGVLLLGAAGCGNGEGEATGNSAPPAKGTPGANAPVGTLGGPPPGSPLNSAK